MDYDVVVIGAGAAGLLAATRAAELGRRTLLLEKNRRAGVKILISGGTRCNLTHDTDARGIVEAYGRQGRFLHSALAALSPADLVALVEAEGVPTKVEPTGKVFPQSDHAIDVLEALLRRLRRSGCQTAFEEPVLKLAKLPAGGRGDEAPEGKDTGFRIVTSKRTLTARHVIVTTGGKSYPGCGTTGDGYAWCAALGHTIVPPRPALTPITTNDQWVRELTGVTIEDADVQVMDAPGTGPEYAALQPETAEPARKKGKRRDPCLARRRGSLLLTHFGLSGPAVLDVSRSVTGHEQPSRLLLVCDFLPSIHAEKLLEDLRQQAAAEGKRHLSALLAGLVPRRLAEALLTRVGLSPESRAAEISKAKWRELVEALKQQAIHVSGTRGFKKAEVTAGGVELSEVDSHSMESHVCAGLYLAGEILDLDGPIGGYNFQAAFSTGWLAGERASDNGG